MTAVLLDANSRPAARVAVTARLVAADGWTSDHTTDVVAGATVTSNTAGVITFTLTPTSAFATPGSYYQLSGTGIDWAVVVPDPPVGGGPVQIRDHLVDPGTLAPVAEPLPSFYLARAELGVALGVASLGADGLVPAAQLPAGNGGGGGAAPDATTTTKGVAVILGGTAAAPTVPYSAVTGKPALASVATSGAYGDLTGRPPIPASYSDLTGTVPQAAIPAVALTDWLGAVASQAAMLALTGQRGDWCTRTDLGTDWQLIAEPSTSLASWREHVYPASPVQSVNGRAGAVVLAAADVGADPAGAAAGAVTAHEAATDPHPGYLTAGEAAAAYDALGAASSAVSAHEAASDPHPQYLTTAEGSAAYQPIDPDLTAIAALAPADGTVLTRAGGAWTAAAAAGGGSDALDGAAGAVYPLTGYGFHSATCLGEHASSSSSFGAWHNRLWVPAGNAITRVGMAVGTAGTLAGGGLNGWSVWSDDGQTMLGQTAPDDTIWTVVGLNARPLVAPVAAQGAGRFVRVLSNVAGFSPGPNVAYALPLTSSLINGSGARQRRSAFVSAPFSAWPATFDPDTLGTPTNFLPFIVLG